MSIANEIMEALAQIRIPGEARQILDVILRKTYGWNKKEDEISLSQFKEKTGLLSPNIIRARNKLLIMNIISVIQKDNSEIPTYRFQKDYTRWKLLSKKIALSKKIINVIQKDNRHYPKRKSALSKRIDTKDTNTKDTNTKTNKERYTLSQLKIDVISKWNKLAQEFNLAPVIDINSGSVREGNLRARSAEKNFDFDLLIDMIRNSPFLLGKTKDPFFVFFDWIVKPTNYQKIIEGNYLDRRSYQRFSGIIQGIKNLEKKYAKEKKDGAKKS
ncbi:MAG: replication protein [candidate division Zixibacteria bacterium]|nr:replication protein [candidate division Zixibacteria bacterium]